ncbi:MAG: sulfurtransferase TusA family protein [Anaerolineae bacterium]|jgi:TusA-related sulfurtransferase
MMAEIKVDTAGGECPVHPDVRVDCRGETCPVPLVEVRKALRKAEPGDVLEVVGTHPASREEIPMAVRALGLELLSVEGTQSDWTICIRR